MDDNDFTLDIPETQVVVNYPADADGFLWHHRILLCRVEGAIWLTLTPDLEIQQHDLSGIRHKVLDRRSAFPPEIAAEIYAHDPISRASLNHYKRQAQTMAVILGQGELPDLDLSRWVVCDSSRSDFGQEIDEMILRDANTGLAFSSKGVIVRGGEEIFIEKVAIDKLEQWKKDKLMDMADVRLLGDHRDASGKRRLDLAKAVSLMREAPDPDFPIAGVRAAKELHEAVLGGPGNFTSYHAEWVRLSGSPKRSSASHIHSSLCECLRLMHHFDQLDTSSLAVGEQLSRWLITVELAVERNPAQPNYEGLDVIGGAAVLQDGRASTARFGEWVSSKMKERSSIWKQERLFRQERRLQLGHRGGTQDDSDDDEDEGHGGGKGKGRKKKKKKNDKKSGGGDDSAPGGAAK